MNPLTVSEAELDILKLLWDEPDLTVRELKSRLRQVDRDWAHTTISTLLTRLEEKKYVTRNSTEHAHRFRAAVSQKSFMSARLADMAESLCDGQRFPLLLAILDEATFTPEEVAEFREFIDRLDPEEKG